MSLKLFYDFISQPSRACYMFLKVNKIPFVPCPSPPRKLEQRTQSFVAANPFHKVPAIDDGNFVLTESNAILKYLAMQYKVPSHWYPTEDMKRQLMIDQYLHWHDFNIRWNGDLFFAARVVKPLTTGLPHDKLKVEMLEIKLLEAAKLFEQHFLGDTPFVSSQEITIADVQAVAEFMQPIAGGFDIFAGRPSLSAWRSRVVPQLQPYFDESHEELFDLGRKVQLAEHNQPVV